MADIDKYIGNLSADFSRLAYDEMENCSAEECLLYLYAYYHYYNADNSKIPDIIEGNVYKWDAADRIAGIYIDEDADHNDVDVVFVHYTEDNTFDFPAILKVFKDIENMLFKAQNDKSSCRKEIFDFIRDDDYQFSQTKPLKIRLITNYNPKTATQKKPILNALRTLMPAHEFVSYHISFGLDIEYEILEIENPKEYVDEAVIQIDKPDNYVQFGVEESIIANMSAKSLKRLYELYGYRGLFAQNLRYYVKNAKIDGNIIVSIQEHPENFWYFNNGVILICDDYTVDGNQIYLYNFSIINGGQTTKLIGETDFDQDFYIQCKIVKNKYSADEDRLEFISQVAAASNTQKPIKDKDLLANRIEQRLLKKQMAAAGVYCQIKRGEKVNKKLYPAAWQNTTNEELGQLLLSFVYQKPGTARGSKASICGNNERYNLLFSKVYNSGLLCDLLKIKAYYKLWMAYTKKNDDGEDVYKVGLVNNGMFFMTAIIGVICKMYYHPEVITAIQNAVMTEQQMEIVSQHDLDHPIFKDYSDAKKIFFTLFEYCYRQFYRPGYEFLKSFKERHNNYSNFTKINNNYNTYIFRQIVLIFQNGIPENDRAYLSSILYDASQEDIERDHVLLTKYVNVIAVDFNAVSNISEEIVEAIKEALTSYRTKKFKEKRIKAYEVFKNASRDRIAKFAPMSIADLIELHCLDKVQLNLYGQDIVDIVQRVLDAYK